jgi:hypothetical protein
VADIMNVLATSYANAPTPSYGKYVDVDPTLYEGKWEGTYSTNQKFQIDVSNVNGFRAKVKYQSGGTIKYQEVLIKDNAFRVGDSKFTLARQGYAQVKTVNVDAATGGTTLDTAYARKTG